MSRSVHSFQRINGHDGLPAPRAELRRHRRRTLVYYLSVTEQVTGRVLGRVGDISEQGLLLLDIGDLKVGARLDLALDLAGVRGLKDEVFEARARVRWTRRHPFGAHAAGLEFEEVGPDQLSAMDLLVWAIGFKDR